MTISSKLAQSRQQRIQEKAKTYHANDFLNILTSPDLLDVVEELLPEHRERKHPPAETLSMFLSQALSQDSSCQKVVNEAAMNMLDTIANQQMYPQQSAHKEGLGVPICRVVGALCLSSGAALNAAVGRFNGKGSDEPTLLRTIQDTFTSDDLVMGDAFFGTCCLLNFLSCRKIDAVFEQMGAK